MLTSYSVIAHSRWTRRKIDAAIGSETSGDESLPFICLFFFFFLISDSVADKYADPYRQYMQSLMCYDLAPSHGAVVLIDSALKV